MLLRVQRNVSVAAQVQHLVCAQHVMPGRRTAMKLWHVVLRRTQFPVAKFRTTRLFSSKPRGLGEWVRDAEKGRQWTTQTPGWRSESIVSDVAELPEPNAGRIAAAKHTSAVRIRKSSMTNTSIITTFSECKDYVLNIALDGWILSVASVTVYW